MRVWFLVLPLYRPLVLIWFQDAFGVIIYILWWLPFVRFPFFFLWQRVSIQTPSQELDAFSHLQIQTNLRSQPRCKSWSSILQSSKVSRSIQYHHQNHPKSAKIIQNQQSQQHYPTNSWESSNSRWGAVVPLMPWTSPFDEFTSRFHGQDRLLLPTSITLIHAVGERLPGWGYWISSDWFDFSWFHVKILNWASWLKLIIRCLFLARPSCRFVGCQHAQGTLGHVGTYYAMLCWRMTYTYIYIYTHTYIAYLGSKCSQLDKSSEHS